MPILQQRPHAGERGVVDGMKNERIIPVTPILLRYQELRRSSQKERLEAAQRLLDRPEEFAAEFGASVSRFASYSNVDDAFYPPNRPNRVPGPTVARTIDLVLRLQCQALLTPSDAANRSTRHNAGPGVIAVPAERLACRYVDREILVQRTTSPATWDDGSRNVGGLRLDLLLVDAEDGTPIVGELKLPGDMDPFFALMQALACAVHLATPHQYERMRRHLPHGHFPDLLQVPRLDVWILSVEAKGVGEGDRPNGRYMGALYDAVESIAPRLLALPEIRRSIRRIAWMRMKAGPTDEQVAEVRWAWEGSPDSAEKRRRKMSSGALL